MSRTMTPGLRKFALTAHIASSVGFLGAVAGFLALAVAGLTSQDARMVRAAYMTMELTAWSVLVPLCLASLLSGLVQSLGTSWGLLRHYWVLAKLLINLFATLVLLMHMPSLGHFAGVAAGTTSSSGDLGELRSLSPVLHSGAALALLLVATTLSVYKPRGRTSPGTPDPNAYGYTGDETVEPGRGSIARTPRWVYVFGIVALLLVLLFVMMLLAGGSHGPGRRAS